ncbi:hypothetical protein KIN20_025665 [Parelaphostrongylus tenuis]|uniref:Uncharacterized protein n=1 Tax=Parelaphostrongylus tenuis TaxID=148309 RepID=A0AAD5MYQ6_PARTN|nr:hypothetical protein KIN20_025665 [Parelaphostrongylus tenuis]
MFSAFAYAYLRLGCLAAAGATYGSGNESSSRLSCAFRASSDRSRGAQFLGRGADSLDKHDDPQLSEYQCTLRGAGQYQRRGWLLGHLDPSQKRRNGCTACALEAPLLGVEGPNADLTVVPEDSLAQYVKRQYQFLRYIFYAYLGTELWTLDSPRQSEQYGKLQRQK